MNEQLKKYNVINLFEYKNKNRRKPDKSDSITDKSKTDEVDIYKCIEKYGIQSLLRQTMAKETIDVYCDATPMMMTLDEKIEYRNQIDEYFKELPAIVRKNFGDNSEIFYNNFKKGNFDEMIKAGIIEEKIAESYKKEIKDAKLKKVEEIRELIKEQNYIENIISKEGEANEKN